MSKGLYDTSHIGFGHCYFSGFQGDFKGQPLREDLLAKGIKPPKRKGPQQLQASFRNSGRDPALKDADLYYDEGLHWGKLGHGDPALNVNTFEGKHKPRVV